MKCQIRVVPIVSFLSAFIFLASFGEQKAEWKGTIEEVDEVTIVKNHKEPMYGEDVFQLSEEPTISKNKER